MDRTVKWAGVSPVSAAATATSDVYTVKPTTSPGAYQATWTGTTAGTIQPQVSLDKTSWTSLAVASGVSNAGEVSPAGSAASATIFITVPCTYLRFVFTRSGGTGNLTIVVHEVDYR